jgi:hypothetical protein
MQGGTGAVLGGALGAAVPAVFQGVGSLLSRFNPLRGAINPEAEAARRVGAAMQSDIAGGSAVLSDDAFRAAQAAGAPVVAADRGGEATRGLARAAANASPEARATLNAAVDPRFEQQGARLASELEDVLGGVINPTATREALQAAAQSANRAAYGKAYAKGDAGVWNDDLAQLVNAPAVQDAIRGAVRSGANKATVAGSKPIRNPFTETPNGFVLTPRPDGSTATPTLAFWDSVKRNLDDQISKFRRSGEKEAASDIQSLKSALVGNLDNTIPEYAAARAGAARYFGAEDALEAGGNFAKSNKPLDEAKTALTRMSGPEKRLFAEGYADAVREKVAGLPDRADAVKRLWQSPREREKLELALGKPAAARLEATMHVEAAMSGLRSALQGNSTTARQLAEMGIIGGGTSYLTGDYTTGAMAGAAAFTRQKVNARVMQRVADLLVSNDPKKIKLLVESASRNPPFMEALRLISARTAGTQGGAVADRATSQLASILTGPRMAPASDSQLQPEEQN